MGQTSLAGKDLISVHELSVEEVELILDSSRRMKSLSKEGKSERPLEGKTVAMVFHKPSTRTRVSFEVGVWQLGGYALYLRADELQLRRGETIADTARVLSRYVDAIVVRTYEHRDVVELARYADVPVINALTDLLHPCQALTDVFTMLEKKGRLGGLKVGYVGDGNNVAHSLMLTCAKLGIWLRVATPPGYRPSREIVGMAISDAKLTGARIELYSSPVDAVRGADVVYTDVWTSMGQEEEREERLAAFSGYQVNAALMACAEEDAIFMHDLPAHRGEEVTDEVMDGPKSVVFDQAENRLHVQKAILSLILGE